MYVLKLRSLQIYIYSTYRVRVLPHALFLSSQLEIQFIIYIRCLEAYIKIRGANSILVPIPSVEGKPTV